MKKGIEFRRLFVYYFLLALCCSVPLKVPLKVSPVMRYIISNVPLVMLSFITMLSLFICIPSPLRVPIKSAERTKISKSMLNGAS